MPIEDIVEDDLEQIVKENDIVLVDLTAEWCPPCKKMAVALQEFDAEIQPEIKICRINVDENRKLPTTLGVTGIPAIVIFYKGSLVCYDGNENDRLIVGISTVKDKKAQLTRIIQELRSREN
jgi:thioredoxin 1